MVARCKHDLVPSQCTFCRGPAAEEPPPAPVTEKPIELCKNDPAHGNVVARGMCVKCYRAYQKDIRNSLDRLERIKKMAKELAERKTIPKEPDPAVGAPKRNTLLLNLDVTNYPDVWPELQNAAQIHIRTTEHQALYYIVAGLKSEKK